MEISIRLYATLRQYTPENQDHYQVSARADIRAVLHQLGVPEDWGRILLVFVNDAIARDFSRELQHGDEMKVFLALGGG